MKCSEEIVLEQSSSLFDVAARVAIARLFSGLIGGCCTPLSGHALNHARWLAVTNTMTLAGLRVRLERTVDKPCVTCGETMVVIVKTAARKLQACNVQVVVAPAVGCRLQSQNSFRKRFVCSVSRTNRPSSRTPRARAHRCTP